MWVTEDEHRRLLERCDGKQLAAWMRQTCLDEKPARAGRLPSISPAPLRQLAGMGNNLNQIARKVNAGGAGHDRVQIVAALMAIDAGLERLRHAVLEKGGMMIVKFHPRGRGGGAGPVDYLLGKTGSARGRPCCRENRRKSGSLSMPRRMRKVHLRRAVVRGG